MSAFQDQLNADLENVFFNPDEFGGFIDWEDVRIKAVVSEVESKGGGFEIATGLERKIVSIMMDTINHQPEFGDQVRLNLDPEKVNGGDIWTVERVLDADGMYDIYFYRNVS